MKVCYLGVAKELHELCKDKGIEMPGSDFYYVQNSTQGEEEWILCKKLIDNKFISLIIGFLISPFSNNVKTYTLDEILEILPARIGDYWLHVDKVGAHYLNDKFKAIKSVLVNDRTNTTTAACKLAIWLIKEGYLTK